MYVMAGVRGLNNRFSGLWYTQYIQYKYILYIYCIYPCLIALSSLHPHQHTVNIQERTSRPPPAAALAGR